MQLKIVFKIFARRCAAEDFNRTVAAGQGPSFVPVTGLQSLSLLRQNQRELVVALRRRAQDIRQGRHRGFWCIRPQKTAEQSSFRAHVRPRVVASIAQCLRQELMARSADAAQIDERFSDLARGILNFRVRVRSSDFARERYLSAIVRKSHALRLSCRVARSFWISGGGQGREHPRIGRSAQWGRPRRPTKWGRRSPGLLQTRLRTLCLLGSVQRFAR
jgi:hypothetical protein